MKDTIINLGKSVLLDGIKLGTASVVGDMLRRGINRAFKKDDGEEDSEKTESSGRRLDLKNIINGE